MTHLSWTSIVRLGLVQLCLGAIVVLTTSTLNRLMVVELALPAVLPGLLVGLHYAIQITRPNWGYRSDTGGNRTRFIILGMAALASGGFLAAAGFVVMAVSFWAGLALSVLAYVLIGLGVGASGTSLLALLASATHPRRRAAAATITWLMMIFGIAVTATVVGKALDPYSPSLLLKLVALVCGSAVVLTILAVRGIERRAGVIEAPERQPLPFRRGIAEIWAEPRARHFTLFIFLSMVAYFMQELILEPYAGLVFGFTPGQSTQLSGVQNGGVFVGMLTVGIAATGLRIGSLRTWVMAGCGGSALALLLLTTAGQIGMGVALVRPATMALGFFNGMFAVAAIAAMMALAGEGREEREGTRMGLWGASQAIAAGAGGLLGAASVDVARRWIDAPSAFGLVFAVEATLFLVSMVIAEHVIDARRKADFGTAIPGE
ncbi:BCD family MFS transporter [Tabrizicola sp. J26]|uniref:BCD family MFS transporter n=1 Tax=Alitabrizicola rongguiensis TaxID=2909234 RepID=UPI001F34D897|nr:BCD family MFS transporter [Tabrizicola rongguiensis]MCF1710701.1 BCD family MFS transporter [Tabrizicola rongguiensis]